MTFQDRREAGRRIAGKLGGLRAERPVVLAIPAGGVPVAMEVAASLRAPLDIVCVNDVGLPADPGIAVGAVAEGDVCYLDRAIAAERGATDADLEGMVLQAMRELHSCASRYRRSAPPLPIDGRTVILVDDGVSSLGRVTAAVRAARRRGAARVVLAAPVAAPEVLEPLALEVDEIVIVELPEVLFSVGGWYSDFTEPSHEEVAVLVSRARAEIMSDSREVYVSTGGRRLPGDFSTPHAPLGAVIFAHGSGSSRLSPRNAAVAGRLNEAGLATLLFDLLTPQEAEDRGRVFDIPLLAGRLVAATLWLRGIAEVWDLPIGYFGASTGAGAALWAAAELGNSVSAVVSRGGRPDLAGSRLAAVVAPTLLVVGGLDERVLALNEKAQRRMRCPTKLEVVAGATHLFDEPGTLETVSELAADWFVRHFARAQRVA